MQVNVIARLEQRRNNILRTLEHLRAEQNQVDSNTEWRDLCAQRRRSEMLAELFGWYNGRLERIDHALVKISRESSRRPAHHKQPRA